jgi:hypothetical protein
MCGKKSKRAWRLLALCLVLSCFSWPVFSQDANSPVAVFLAAAQEIAQKHPDAKPQLLQMGNALQAISEKSQAATQALQTTIDAQAQKISNQETQISNLEQSQKDYEGSVTAERLGLRNDLGDAQTSATIGWTVAGIGVLGDIIQIVLHGLKLW